MKRLALALAVLALAAAAYAGAPEAHIRNVQVNGVAQNSAASLDSVLVDAACATDPAGSKCCYDNVSARCGFPLTDAAASTYSIRGYSGAPLGTGSNDDGTYLVLMGGIGAKTIACVQANCTATTDTYTPTENGAAIAAITADAALTDATHFACGATDNAMCVNLCTAIRAATAGMECCTGADCTLFTGVSGTTYVWPTLSYQYSHVSSDETATDTNTGLDGKLTVPDGSSSVPSVRGVGDADTGVSFNVSVGRVGIINNGAQSVSFQPSVAEFSVPITTTTDVTASDDLMVTDEVIGHIGEILFCGQGPNATATVYLSPRSSGLFGDATCDAEDNTTEATADEVWAAFDFTAVAMECGITDVAADATGVTFAFRDDTADASSDLSCVTGATDGAGFASCNDRDTTPPVVAAGSAIAMSAVAATGNFTTGDIWCRLTVSD